MRWNKRSGLVKTIDYETVYKGIISDSAFRKVHVMDKKRIATLFLIVLMDTAGATAIVPLIPVYVLARFHATPFQAGLLLAAYYAAQVLAAPWLGKLSDRFGRRPILLPSQAGTIVSYLLIVFAVPLGALLDHTGAPLGIAGGLIVIFLARILDGVTGGNVSVAQAYASDISTPEERTRALGLVGGAFGLGLILGPALVGLLALLAPTTLVAPLLGAALVSGVTLLLTLLWLREPLRREDGKEMGAQPADGVPLAQVLRSLPVVLVLLGSLLQLVSAVGLFAVSELGAVIVFVVIFAFGYGISSPTLQSLMTSFGSERMAGRLLGVFQSVSSVAFILSMVWGTYVFDYVSPRAVFAVSAVLLALAVVGSVGILRHKPARESGGPVPIMKMQESTAGIG
jgi:MFS family permease